MEGIFGYPEKIKARVLLKDADPNAPFGYIIEAGENVTLTYNDVNRTLTINASGGGDTSSTYVTIDDETGTLTNSRYVVAGNNITLDTSITGQLVINAAATGGGAPTTASYVTITTEPSLSAERYLAEAYGVTITDNTTNVSVGLSPTFLAIPFLCLSNPSGLNGERSFQVAGGLSSSDLGAGSTFTVSGSAFQAPEYIVAQADATIPNAKVLQAGTGLNLDTTSSAVLTNTASSFGQVVVAGQDTIYAFRLQDAIEFAQGAEITLTVSGSTLTIATTAEQNQNTFSVVAASGWPNISSSSVTDTLNILAQDGLYAGTIPGSNTLVLSGSGISGGNSFGIITVSGQSDVTASTATDTVEFIGAGALNITTSGNQITFTASVTGGSGAPTDAQYLVLSADPTLSDERVLVVGTGLSLSDGGAGNNATLTNTASSFGKVVVFGQNTILANILQDQFGFVPGDNVLLTVTGSDITIAVPSATGQVNQNAFSNIAVSGQNTVVADSTQDTFTLVNGQGIDVTTNDTTDSLTITNTASGFGRIEITGQNDVIAYLLQDQFKLDPGTNITIVPSGSTITIATTAEVNQFAFKTIQVSGQSDVVADATEDILVVATGNSGIEITTGDDSLTFTNTASGFGRIVVEGQSDIVANFLQSQFGFAAGSNITFTVSGSTLTINSTASGGSGGNAFETFSVAGQNDIVADSSTDTFTFVKGSGINITTDDTTDSLTITNAASGFSRIAIQGQSDVLAYLLQDQFGLIPGGSVTIVSSGSDITISSTGEANQNAFSTFDVSGQNSVVADSTQDTVTLVEGSRGGLGITTNDTTDSITFTNTSSGYAQILVSGQSTLNAMQLQDSLNLIASTGISITTTLPSSITITNSSPNVDQNLFSTVQPVGFAAITAGSTTDTLSIQGSDGITVGNISDILTVSGSGLQPIDANLTRLSGQSAPSGGQLLIGTSAGGYAVAAPIAGWGIGVSLGDGSITINSLATGEANQNAFSNIAVSGQNTIVADSTQDTLTVATGQGISATTNDTTDTLTLTNTASGFSRIKVSGQNDVVAYLLQDQAGFVAGTGMTITTSGSSITFASSGGSGNGLFKAANISSTLRTHPTTGSISGTYVHSGNVTTTGALTIESGTRSYIKGNFVLDHASTVSSNGNGAPHITDGGNANAGGLGPGTSGGYLGGGGDAGGGGAGYGNGGDSQVVTYGSPGGQSSGRAGVTYGGSGGGATYYGAGAAGGGFWYIEVDGDVTINQNLSANGAASSAVSAYSGGGGGGGTIIIRATGTITIASSKSISCKGGAAAAAGSARGGGGGGGFIQLWAPTVTISGSTSVSGGAGANNGSAGLAESITAAPISLF